MSTPTPAFIGLMSGTSLDGVDGVLARFGDDGAQTLSAAYIPFAQALRAELAALQVAGANEIEREAAAANVLVAQYAHCVQQLLNQAGVRAAEVRAIGVHGQTIRHRPERGYTRQTNNPALLAELCGIDVIADLRSRDIAAGGQGAPLVPAFHCAVFAKPGETRVVANIGGIGNITVLGDSVIGFDTGPGNVLMDTWTERHRGENYDAGGAWAATGTVNRELLEALRSDSYFDAPPPKSTGRDLFNPAWLDRALSGFDQVAPVDVQATLAAFTATTLADAIVRHAPAAKSVYVCGGGAYNLHLMRQLEQALQAAGKTSSLASTEALGVSPNHVEALAFGWLAMRFCERLPGNLPAVTGARGERILGALYPA